MLVQYGEMAHIIVVNRLNNPNWHINYMRSGIITSKARFVMILLIACLLSLPTFISATESIPDTIPDQDAQPVPEGPVLPPGHWNNRIVLFDIGLHSGALLSSISGLGFVQSCSQLDLGVDFHIADQFFITLNIGTVLTLPSATVGDMILIKPAFSTALVGLGFVWSPDVSPFADSRLVIRESTQMQLGFTHWSEFWFAYIAQEFDVGLNWKLGSTWLEPGISTRVLFTRDVGIGWQCGLYCRLLL